MHRHKKPRANNHWPIPANVLNSRQSKNRTKPGRVADQFDVNHSSSTSSFNVNDLSSSNRATSDPSQSTSPSPAPGRRARLPPRAFRTPSRTVPHEISMENTRRLALNTQYSESEESDSSVPPLPPRLSRPTDSVRSLRGIKIFDNFLRHSSMDRTSYDRREIELGSLPLHFDHLVRIQSFLSDLD
jgi:hypothetical protein